MKVTDVPSKEVSFCKSNLQTVKEKAFSTLRVRFQLKGPSIPRIPDNAVLLGPCNSGAPDEQCQCHCRRGRPHSSAV
jgi:hypothetical protein